MPRLITDQAVRSTNPQTGAWRAIAHVSHITSDARPEPGNGPCFTVTAGTLHAMTQITPARALLLLVGGLICLTTASGAMIGALFGDALVALVAAACAGAAGALGALFFRRRALAHFAQAQRQAGIRGYAEGIAHGVLLHVAAYEAAVFPRTGPAGVSPQERAARRTLAYRMAALDEVPRPVREAAADTLAVLDAADRTGAEEALAQLAAVVRREYAGP
jgi:hypothetical protein